MERRGPWAEALVAAVGGDDVGLPVDGLLVVEGEIAGRVDGCEATLAAEPVPSRLWTAMWRFARGNGPLEAAVEGREQSEHLQHLLQEDWEVELVPARVAVSCSCDGPVACAHVAALARAAADGVDRDPAALLRWRGCTPERVRPGPAEPEDADEPPAAAEEDWQAGELPVLGPARPLPAGAVLKRLGPAGVRVGDRDLVEALEPAYEAFSAPGCSEPGSIPNDAENVSPGSSVSRPSPD